MSGSEIARKAISKMNKMITNEIFKIIQNDPDLMQEYSIAVTNSSSHTVNCIVGKEIKNEYKLVNINEREDDPSCTLIQSHQKFE